MTPGRGQFGPQIMVGRIYVGDHLHLWTQIRSNCHVECFVVKRIIDQYKNRMFIHCRRGLYRNAWLSRDIYLSCVSQYWQGIKRAAMLTNRYGRSFQWGKSLSKDFKRLILDELTDCYGGNKDTMFIKYGAFSKMAEKIQSKCEHGFEHMEGTLLRDLHTVCQRPLRQFQEVSLM